MTKQLSPKAVTAVDSLKPSTTPSTPVARSDDRLPISGLLALATACFISILTEVLPAGLLPQIGSGLGVSASATGQLVTAYALGQLLMPIPFASFTQHLRRRPLLIGAILGFAVTNLVTAISTQYALTLVFRFLAGLSAGVLWSLAGGYAVRMVAPHLSGRALAIAMVGTPVALSIGAPAGTLLGTQLGWHYTFGVMSVLGIIVLGWVLVSVPDFPGTAAGRRIRIGEMLAIPGMKTIELMCLGLPLAHNILYTYIAPYLAFRDMPGSVSAILLVFGLASLGGIWLTGVVIDRRLHESIAASIGLFLLACLIFCLGGDYPAMVYLGVAIWGLAFGGYATMVQTASARIAGPATDLAQASLVSTWSAAIAGGGLAGGALLHLGGAAPLPWILLILLAPTLLMAVRAWRKRLYG